LPKSDGTAIKIIIADDHAIFRDGLRRLLASEKDFTVIGEAADGEQAISLTRQLKPDILLLDLAMPRKPGMETLRDMAEMKLPVHVILLTAAIHPFEVTCALQLGARGVVLKASPPELLLKSIRAVSEGQHWVASEVLSDWARIAKEPTGAGALTSREVEIVSAIRSGSSNREIAQKLSISEETVKRHLSNIFGKLGVSSRLELALLASRHNLGS
jgi:two-component system, NarL family, nitrate/nitrite response regulator NarL